MSRRIHVEHVALKLRISCNTPIVPNVGKMVVVRRKQLNDDDNQFFDEHKFDCSDGGNKIEMRESRRKRNVQNDIN